jgi:hypothetical protein
MVTIVAKEEPVKVKHYNTTIARSIIKRCLADGTETNNRSTNSWKAFQPVSVENTHNSGIKEMITVRNTTNSFPMQAPHRITCNEQ